MKSLKELRILSGIKANKVAEILGISRTQLYNLEKGMYKLSDDKIKKLSDLYKATEVEIQKGVEKSER